MFPNQLEHKTRVFCLYNTFVLAILDVLSNHQALIERKSTIRYRLSFKASNTLKASRSELHNVTPEG